MAEKKKNENKHQVRGTLIFNDDESYSAYLNGDANFNSGLRNRDKGTMYRQPDFEEDVENYDDNEYTALGNYEKTELTPKQQETAQILVEALAAGIMWIATEVVAPNVKYWWQNSAAPVLKDKWNGIIGNEKTVKNIAKSKATTTTPAVAPASSVSNVFYQELDDTYENYATNMTSEEAQRELLDIFILSAMIAAKVKRLSNANIVDEQDMIYRLTAPEYINGINRILQSNPELLEEKSASLSEILGRSLIMNGAYEPIKNNQLKERLLVRKNNR